MQKSVFLEHTDPDVHAGIKGFTAQRKHGG